MYFILFRNKDNNLWYWNLHTQHHHPIANGADGHISEEDARNNLQLVRRHAPFCRIYNKEIEDWEKQL